MQESLFVYLHTHFASCSSCTCFGKKWPWIVSSFLFPPRMIHCLLSLQLNWALEYQKMKTMLFSNKLIYLERTRITSLLQNLVSGAFRWFREAIFPFILRWSSFHLGLTMTPDCLSYLSSHHAVQFSSSTIQFSQAQSPSEPPLLSDNHPFRKSIWHFVAEVQAHSNIVFPLPQGTNTVFAAATSVQSLLTLGSLSILASHVTF